MSGQAVQVDVNEGVVNSSTLSDFIIRYLLQCDVDYIFCVQGGVVEPLYGAVARNQRASDPMFDAPVNSLTPLRKRNRPESVSMIIARHEADAAFMADGYARETGKLGVCCSTGGSSSIKLMAGVASAYVDRVPMLVITPQTALPNFGSFGLQESSGDTVDVVKMFESCTCYSSLVSHPKQLETKLFKALTCALRLRGPVHLGITCWRLLK